MQTKDFSKIFVRIYPEDGEATSRAAPTVTMIRLAPDGKELAPIPESAVIWRYMSLAKLVDLLSQRSLWLSRADLLDDPFEGSTPWLNIEQRVALSEQDSVDHQIAYETIRRWVVVNCWQLSEHESDAMWRLYTQSTEGIAIKSTIARLHNQLKGLSSSGLPSAQVSDLSQFFLGPVIYLDHRHTEIIKGPNSLMSNFFLKRPSFAYELEYRIVAPLPNLYSEHGVGDAETPLIKGIGIPIDPVSLIVEVVVGPLAPTWFRDVVINIVKTFSPTLTVRQSSLNETPKF